MNQTDKWEKRRDVIEWMVHLGMKDPEIARIYGVSDQNIWVVRKKFDIASLHGKKVKRGKKALAKVFFAPSYAAPEPLVATPYVDESGLTVNRYPARTAAGAFTQGNMVFPKRGGR